MASTEYFVRLKPRNVKRRKGVPLTPNRYMFRGVRFDAERGWYRIADRALAKELQKLTHNDHEDGIRIFDVTDEAGAKAIAARERRQSITAAPEDANPIASAPAVSRRVAARGGAIETTDVRPEPEEPAMIDGADGDELDLEGDEDGGEGVELGQLDDEGDEVEGSDDLLNGDPDPDAEGDDAPAASAPARTRKATTKKSTTKKATPRSR